MARIWIDVENATGDKLGSGPITTATDWTYNPTLDEAGAFSFLMPAGDSQAALLQNRRIVRCHMEDGGEIREVGTGIIDQVKYNVADPTMLEVSGPDLFGELAVRIIPELTVCEQALIYLTQDDTYGFWRGAVRWVQDGPPDEGTFDVDLTDAHDGNIDSGGSTCRIWRYYGYHEWLYVGCDARFDEVHVWIDAPDWNDAETALEGQYYDGSGWGDLPSMVDGTKYEVSPGVWATMRIDGEITFTRPSDWTRYRPTAVEGEWFWVRFRVGAGSTTVEFNIREIAVWGDTATDDGVNLIMAYAPDTWTQSGYSATAADKYLELKNESVLAALRALGEQGGQGVATNREHFRLATGREIDWFSTFTDSGLRAENAIDPGDDVCLIRRLREVRDTAEVVTRIYPQSNDGIGLELCTRTPPANYTLDTTNGYLESDTGVAAYGRIDSALRFTDLSMQQTDSWWLHPSFVSNALYDRALEYLRTHAAEQHFYDLDLMHVGDELVPGDTIRVVYHEYRDGYHAVDVDATLYILATRQQVDVRGFHTVGLDVATADRTLHHDATLLRSTIQDVRRLGTGQAGIWNISLGSASATGDTVIAGPGIDVTADGHEKTVGIGGNMVLLYHADRSAVDEYAMITLGLAAASTGAMVQPQAGTYSESFTIPAEIELIQRGYNTIIDGTVTNNGIWSVPVTQLPARGVLIGPTAGNRTQTGQENTYAGHNAGLATTTGYRNVAIGARAMEDTTEGYGNVAIGVDVMPDATGADYNVGVGLAAGGKWTTARYNVAIGYRALDEVTDETENVAIGYDAGTDAQCHQSVLIGSGAGASLGYGNTTYENVVIGYSAARVLSAGQYNVAVGSLAMRYATGGDYNIGIGHHALDTIDPGGDYNIAIGPAALIDLSTGDYNVAAGGGAGENTITTGQYNTILGYQAQRHATSGYNATRSILLGYNAYTTADNTCVIGGATTDAVDVVIGGPTAASGQVHVDQAATDGAQPVLLLDQADVSEEFVRFIGSAAAASLTQSIVAEADVTTATRAGFVKVYVQDDGDQITDQAYYMPVYTLA